VTKEQVKDDPFTAPFEPGMFISELTETHSLVFNKFSVCCSHVIVITKEFEKQTDPVSFADFEASLMAMRSLDAFMFYNSGFQSGASILHKHLQVIPYASLQSGLLPVEAAAEVRQGLFQISQFEGMQHRAFGFSQLIMLRCDTEEGLASATEEVEAAYWACLADLGNSAHQPGLSYNILLTQKFLLVVNRQQEALRSEGATVGVNCLGFGGTLAVKRQTDLDYLKEVGPLGILKAVAM